MTDEDNARRSIDSLRNVLWIVVVLLATLVLIEGARFLSNWRTTTRTPGGSPSPSPGQPTAQVTRGSSGSIQTPLGYGFVLNKESSLQREWVVINPPDVPAAIIGAASLVTTYKSGSYSGSYVYNSKFEIDAKEPLTAVEVSFLTFDVWGEHDRKLVSRDIVDFGPGKKTFAGEWNVVNENEASEFYASIAYVSRVRTKGGRVLTANLSPVVEEARRFSSRFTESDIEPPKASPIPSSSPPMR